MSDNGSHNGRDQRLIEAMSEVLKGATPDHDPVAHDAERARFMRAIAAEPTPVVRPLRWQRAVGALAAAALVAGLAGLLWPRTRPTPAPASTLGVTVEALVATEQGSYTLEEDGVPGQLTFDDGSTIVVSAGEVLLASTTAHGAEVDLVEGTAHFEIHHADATDWRINAGSSVVRVTGTAFELQWSPDTDELVVELHEGQVEVDVATTDDPVVVDAGQRLVVRHGVPQPSAVRVEPRPAGDVVDAMQLASAAVAATVETIADRTASPNTGAPPSAAEEAPGRAGTAPEPRERRPEPSDTPRDEAPAEVLDWPAAVAAGEFDAVIADAESRLDRVLRRRPVDDLVALSEAARYARRSDIAEQALQATRDRFGGSRHGVNAAFYLGRHYEREGDLRDAASWYATYRDEAGSSGHYDEQAMGRQLGVLTRLGRDDEARSLAAAYLERYPDGSYAPAARTALE